MIDIGGVSCEVRDRTIMESCINNNEDVFKKFLRTKNGESIRLFVTNKIKPTIETQEDLPEPRDLVIMCYIIDSGYSYIMSTGWFGTWLGKEKRKPSDSERLLACNLAYLLYKEGMGFGGKTATIIDKISNGFKNLKRFKYSQIKIVSKRGKR